MLTRVLCFLLALFPLLAQSDRGTITGRILDPAGAVVPDARVDAVHQGTKVKYTAASNETGVYTIQQLPVGAYDVTVEAVGFSRYLRRDVEINVAQTVTLNVGLTVGAVDQTVEVTAAAPALETNTSDVGTVVTRAMVMDLPLSVSGNMRNPESFIFLAPGVTGDTTNTQINGSQSRAKEVLVDGVGSTSPESGGVLFTYPSVEAIAEFKLLSSNYSAEYGRTGGGFEIFTTKSGTNGLHGSLFDYLRNDALDARGFFARSTPVNRQNEFGFALGGPVLIPKVYDGRNKSFFHVVYSGFRFRQGATNTLTTIPPSAFRTGDFSTLTDRNNRPVAIYDPNTTRSDGAGGVIREQFPGNIIPQARISAVSSKIVALYPGTINSSLFNNFLTTGAKTFDRDQLNIKIDHAFSDRSRLSGFAYIGTQATVTPELLPMPLSPAKGEDYRSRWARLTHDYIVSPSVLNHFTLGFTREGQFWATLSADQGWPDKLGLKGVLTGKGDSFPIVTFNNGYNTLGGSEITTLTDANNKSVGSQVNNTWQLSDSVSWIRGNHTFKFGGEARWLQTNGADFFLSQGRFNFNSLETALPTAAGRTTTGDAFASFLLGAVDTSAMNVLAVVPGNRYRYLAGYVQDDWKITRTLTLNVGMRYDLFFPRKERFDNMSGFDPNLANPAAGNRAGAIAFLGEGAGRTGAASFANTYYRNFGPRFGFAWSMNERTVVRGGYGIYYAPGNATAGLRSSQNFGFGFNASPTPSTTDGGVTPAFNWDSGFPQNFVRPPMISPTVANDQAVNYIGPDDGRPPYFQNWNVGVQRELPARVMVEANYVGNKGTRLGTNLININELDPKYLSLGSLLSRPVTSPEAQAAGIAVPYAGFNKSVGQALRPYPQYLAINQRSNPNGNSTYHSLQVKGEKRMSMGLSWLAAYTWSKSLSDGNIQAGGGPSGQTYYNRALEKSISTDDVPHAVAISFLYELPFGPGKKFFNRGGVIGKLAGGWTFTGIHQYSAGKPMVLSANNTLPVPSGGVGGLRPNVISGVERRADFSKFDPATDRLINPAAFALPAAFSFGTAARAYTDLRAFSFLNESWGVVKRTGITERVSMTFRAEFFNVFNRVVFAAPAANISAANFGRVSAQANNPRQGQVALKLEF
ncbi:MAG TPA: TonB-dependent receptor [Bryobacteraceae bacterium]|nr:TonB-dependent receptor [Bryobacteraceae bacterium]